MKVRRSTRRTEVVPLLDFVPAATPRFSRPTHLAPLAALLERAEREAVRGVANIVVRHGKTTLLKHEMARRLRANPTLRVIYASYADRFAGKQSRETRAIYRRIGGALDAEANARADWRTGVDDGGLWATSIDGSVTGEGGDLIIVDDPHKGRAEAESAIEREKVRDWFFSDLYSRAEPNASIIVVSSRWHPEDLSGHLIGLGWESVVLPAIDDQGRALWPERFPVERLREIEETIGPYAFASLYQQRPMPRGGALFKDVRFYDRLPDRFRIGKGIDVAYSAKTRADASAAVVIYESGGDYYVVDVRTARVQTPEWLAILASLDTQYPGPWHWYTSTTETGLADLATATAGVHVIPQRATVDKYMRAQPVSAAWNAGRVHLPRNAPWLDAFVAEVCGFVGVGDRRDDQVDALASAFDAVMVHGAPRRPGDGPSCKLITPVSHWGGGAEDDERHRRGVPEGVDVTVTDAQGNRRVIPGSGGGWGGGGGWGSLF